MGSLANAYGADKTSVLNGWVHPAERPAQPPRTEVLYGKEWSAADAAYARQLMADEGLTAADLARLWATNRPSVRSEQASSQAEHAPAKLNTDDSQAEHVPPAVTAFAEWLIGSGLTVRAVAQRFGVAPGTVHNWKAKGAPADVMIDVMSKP